MITPMKQRFVIPAFCAFALSAFALSALSLSALTLSALPVQAEEEDGFSLMEEGAKLFMRGIMQEMEPAIDEMRGLAEEMEPVLRQMLAEMGPAFAELLDKVDDITLYHPPELLPNGDIILRRKTEEDIAEQPQDDGAIDL